MLEAISFSQMTLPNLRLLVYSFPWGWTRGVGLLDIGQYHTHTICRQASNRGQQKSSYAPFHMSPWCLLPQTLQGGFILEPAGRDEATGAHSRFRKKDRKNN